AVANRAGGAGPIPIVVIDHARASTGRRVTSDSLLELPGAAEALHLAQIRRGGVDRIVGHYGSRSSAHSTSRPAIDGWRPLFSATRCAANSACRLSRSRNRTKPSRSRADVRGRESGLSVSRVSFPEGRFRSHDAGLLDGIRVCVAPALEHLVGSSVI